MAKRLEKSWTVDPIISAFINLLISLFIKIFYEKENSWAYFHVEINILTNFALENIIKRLLIYNFCISNNTNMIELSKLEDIIKNTSNFDWINGEVL